MTTSRIVRWTVFILLLVHSILLGYIACVHSATTDEVAHIVAGVRYWHTGTFDLYHVNPPLLRLIHTVPIVALSPTTDWRRLSKNTRLVRSQWVVGADFVAANSENFRLYLVVARFTAACLSIVAGYTCYCWSRDLYGIQAGLVSLSLWSFSPMILGHAALVSTDAGAAAFGVLAAYRFSHWMNIPSWKNATIAGVVFGLCQLSKTIWIILFLLWPLFWMCRFLVRRYLHRNQESNSQLGQLCYILLVGLFIINYTYCFEGTFQRLRKFEFLSAYLRGTSNVYALDDYTGNRFRGTWLGSVPVPLPRNYVLGIDSQKRDIERRRGSYLFGQWSREGWWYFYLVGFAVKMPIGTLLLVSVAMITTLIDVFRRCTIASEGTVISIAIAVIFLLSSQTEYTLHFRYAIAAYPFLFILAGRLLRHKQRHRRHTRRLVVALLAASATSSLFAYPHSLSFFSAIARGPGYGKSVLLDSNIDWGQDLLYLKSWLTERGLEKPLYLAYWGEVDPKFFGIDYQPMPVSRDMHGVRLLIRQPLNPGLYAISVNMLHDQRQQYDYLTSADLVGRAGYSIEIYEVK